MSPYAPHKKQLPSKLLLSLPSPWSWQGRQHTWTMLPIHARLCGGISQSSISVPQVNLWTQLAQQGDHGGSSDRFSGCTPCVSISRGSTSEGAEAAHVTATSPAGKTAHGVHEGRNDGTLQCWSGGTNFGLSLTPSLPLDNASWPLHKNDSQDLRCLFF